MNRHESWEGIKNNTLRVFVKLDIPYAAEQEHTDISMTENLMNAGLNRAGIILMSFIRIHLTDFERIESCRKKIEGLQKNGKMLYQKCTEVSCTALIDFDITEFLEAAGRHESEP
jgi:predicted nuclease with TOPRIM domain